jgi:hypothetical protein
MEEININVVTKTITGGKIIKLTVRKIFYVGLIGKIKTILVWLFYKRGMSFRDYLSSPVTYTIEMDDDLYCYRNIDAEKELEQLLKEQKEWEKQ